VSGGADVLFRDYRPYSDADVRVEYLPGDPPNPVELRRMNEVVAAVLDGMSLEAYLSARDGLASAEGWIHAVLDHSGLELRGRVLEFGAGNAKLAAILSRLPAVDEVVANDFSEPLLREVAPRVACALGGELGKIRYLVGDMHALPELDQRFDAIVCYLAVHHLLLPESFFRRIAGLLEPGGTILCVREPAIPRFGPFRRVRAAVENAREHRREGESEHIYTVDEYRRLAEPTFSFRLAYASMFERRLTWLRDWLPPNVWTRPFEIGYVLELASAVTTALPTSSSS
jgi:SAM-dependent methyltransferase